ncbi:hypothetical protein Plhal304r1_c039g0116711 [Plasmopara halstedii]
MTRKTPSLAGFEGARRQSPSFSAQGASPDSTSAASREAHPKPSAPERNTSRPPRSTNFYVEELEEVDYKSDTPFPAWDNEKNAGRQRRVIITARTLRTPCSWSCLSIFGESDIVTNCLDEAQEQQMGAVDRADFMRLYQRSVLDPSVEYGVRSVDPATEAKYAITRSLGVYVVGPPATNQTELDQREALRDRFSVLQEIPIDRYHARLGAQKEGAFKPTIRTIAVLLAPGEPTVENEEIFDRWVQRHHNHFSLSTLQQSHKEVDVHVERHHRFEFAKLTAQRRLPAYFRPATHGIFHHAPTSRFLTWIRRAHDIAKRHYYSDQKCPRRLGSPVEVAPQTPTSSWSLNISATSQDIGLTLSATSTHKPFHLIVDAAILIRKSWRRTMTRGALRALENKSLEHFMRCLPHIEDYGALSERPLAVVPTNTSHRATVERLAPLKTRTVALRAHTLLLVQFLGGFGRRPIASAFHLRRILCGLLQANTKLWDGAHPSRRVRRIRKVHFVL